MSSVIVLDSSDSEDETPSNQKRQLVIEHIGCAKLVPLVSLTTSAGSTTVTTTKTTMATNKKSVLIPKGSIKSINIPRGITVTRHSPVTVAKNSSSAVLIPQKTGQPKSNIRLSIVKKAPTQNTPKTTQPLQITPLVVSNSANAQRISAASKQITQQQQILISGVKRAATSPITAAQPKIIKLQEQDVIVRRKSPTATPASSLVVTTSSNVIVRTSAASGLMTTAGRVVATTQPVKRTNAPALVKVSGLSSTTARTPESTQRLITTTASSANCFKSNAARPLRPIISVDVDAITASATPPLRLLASPPHHSVETAKEPLHLQLNLPPDTTVTAQQTPPKLSPPIQKQPQQPQPLKINSNPSVKRVTPTPAASPMAAALPPQLSPSPKIVSAESINKMPGRHSPKTKLPPISQVANNNSKELRYNSPIPKTTTSNQPAATRTKPATSITTTATITRLSTSGSANTTAPTPLKRIKPTTLVSKTDTAWQNRSSTAGTTAQQAAKKFKPSQIINVSSRQTAKDNEPMMIHTPSTTAPPAGATAASPRLNGGAADLPSGSSTASQMSSETTKANVVTTKEPEKRELDADYAELVKVCRKADAGADMERLIEIKLLKYYNDVHENFARSRGFRKTVRSIIEAIRTEPDMVYLHLKTVIDELKVRRKVKVIKVSEEESHNTSASGSSAESGASVSNKSAKSETIASSPAATDVAMASPAATITITATTMTGNKRTDEHIRKLNRALHIVTKRIEALETAEVDLNDEDSSYLQVERYKKRACQLYEKICDLTGENKNALRVVRKPIQFKDTAYPEFNKTLQTFINRTREFPDYYDVLRMLEHCNTQYDMGLANFEMKRIAHDAFTKVGKLLQARRKTDLYETVTHFTANCKDPAAEDVELAAKLNENKKNQKKISDILEKYAREQDLTAEEQREARLKERQQAAENNAKDNDADGAPSTSSTAPAADSVKVINAAAQSSDEEEDDDDDDDDDEDEVEDDELDVDKLANGHLSDADSDAETLVEVDRSKVVLTPQIAKTTEQVVISEIVELNDTLDDVHEAVVDEANRKKPIKAKTEKINEDAQERNGVRVVKSRSDTKTINNNTMRVKTGNGTTITATSTSTAASLVQNGKVKSHTSPQKTNTVSGNNNNSPLIKQSASAIQTLKIMSVSSLNASLATLSEHHQPQQQHQLRLTPPVQLSSGVPSPYTEIVISDEES